MRNKSTLAWIGDRLGGKSHIDFVTYTWKYISAHAMELVCPYLLLLFLQCCSSYIFVYYFQFQIFFFFNLFNSNLVDDK